jgi:hypothetical protein
MEDRKESESGITLMAGSRNGLGMVCSVLSAEGIDVHRAGWTGGLPAPGSWTEASASAIGPAHVVFADVQPPARPAVRAGRGWSVPVLFASAGATGQAHAGLRRRYAPVLFDEPGGPGALGDVLLLLAPPWMFPGTVERATSALTAMSSYLELAPSALRATVLGFEGYEETDAGDVLWYLDSAGELGEIGASAVHADTVLDSDLPLDLQFDPGRHRVPTGMRVLPVVQRLGVQAPFLLLSAFGDFESSRRGRHLGFSLIVVRPAASRHSCSVLVFAATWRARARSSSRH